MSLSLSMVPAVIVELLSRDWPFSVSTKRLDTEFKLGEGGIAGARSVAESEKGRGRASSGPLSWNDSGLW